MLPRVQPQPQQQLPAQIQRLAVNGGPHPQGKRQKLQDLGLETASRDVLLNMLHDRNRQLDSLQSENAKMKQALQVAQQQSLCCHCKNAERNCLVQPCLHFLFCATCVQGFLAGPGRPTCPACCMPMNGVTIVFLNQT
eukprot:jgi/Astpho2/529/Aster-03561